MRWEGKLVIYTGMHHDTSWCIVLHTRARLIEPVNVFLSFTITNILDCGRQDLFWTPLSGLAWKASSKTMPLYSLKRLTFPFAQPCKPLQFLGRINLLPPLQRQPRQDKHGVYIAYTNADATAQNWELCWHESPHGKAENKQIQRGCFSVWLIWTGHFAVKCVYLPL